MEEEVVEQGEDVNHGRPYGQVIAVLPGGAGQYGFYCRNVVEYDAAQVDQLRG